MQVSYPYRLIKKRGRYHVQFLDLDDAATQSASLEEARLNAAEALSRVLEARIDDGFDVPRPSSVKGKDIYHAEPDSDIQVVLLVHWARQDKGVTLADLARSLNTSWASAKRLEKPGNNPTLKSLQDVAARLGKRLVVTFE